MAYQGQVGDGTTLTVENDGQQTQIRLHRDGQQQGSGLTTGKWTAPPTLWRTGGGAVLQIEGAGQTFVEMSGGGVRSLGEAPNLAGAQKVALSEVEDGGRGGMKPMIPMEPLEPMKPPGEDD